VQEFLFLYRLPMAHKNSDGDVAAWNTWLASLGEDLRDVGKPVIAAATVGTGAHLQRLTGYSIVAATDVQTAEEIASRCPALASGGAVEVGTLIEMPEGHGPESE
jgi:hypothetical protein